MICTCFFIPYIYWTNYSFQTSKLHEPIEQHLQNNFIDLAKSFGLVGHYHSSTINPCIRIYLPYGFFFEFLHQVHSKQMTSACEPIFPLVKLAHAIWKYAHYLMVYPILNPTLHLLIFSMVLVQLALTTNLHSTIFY